MSRWLYREQYRNDMLEMLSSFTKIPSAQTRKKCQTRWVMLLATGSAAGHALQLDARFP